MSNEQVVGMVKLDGDYAATILSYYLWGSAEAPKPSEISDKKFIREQTDPNIPYLTIGTLGYSY